MHVLIKKKSQDISILMVSRKYPTLEHLTNKSFFNDLPLRDIKLLISNGKADCSYQTTYEIVKCEPEIDEGED